MRMQRRSRTNNMAVAQNEAFFIWQKMLSPQRSFGEYRYPKLVQDDDSYLDEFKAHVHNVFQHSFIQEMEGVESDYVYFLSYLPPARYYYDYAGMLNKPESEGLFLLKLQKSDLATVDKKLYNAVDYPFLAYDRTPQMVGLDAGYEKMNLTQGAFHGFQDGNYIYVFYFAQDTNNTNQPHVSLYYMKINITNLNCEKFDTIVPDFDPAGAQIIPRFQKMDDRVYFSYVVLGYYYCFGCCEEASVTGYPGRVPSFWLITTAHGAYNSTKFHSDFCMVKSETGVPIRCMLAFNSKAYRTSCTAEHFWSTTYMNWDPQYVCLCLHSYPTNPATYEYTIPDSDPYSSGFVYPSDTLYNTTLVQNNNTIASAENTSKSDFYRLYLNSHKIVPYTSPSGKKYFIFAYCYPGKKTHLYIGYCTYYIDNLNFVHLGTKVVLKSPDDGEEWGDSFSYLTDCRRIISLDIKDGEVWLTWMSANETLYYFFHIKASDLISE